MPFNLFLLHFYIHKRKNDSCSISTGEAASVPTATVEEWKKRLPDVTAGYDLQDIFNADETGVYYRSLPNKSMVLKKESRKGLKTSKERITVLIACSATGKIFIPFLIKFFFQKLSH